MRLCLGIVFLSGQHACQIFEIQGQINMVRSKCLFTNVQGPFKEGQGFLIVLLRVVQGREVTQADGELRVAVSKNFFIQADGATQQRFGLFIFPLRVMEPGQFGQRSGQPGILFSEGFRYVERGGVLFLGLFDSSLLKEKITLVHVPVPRGFRVLASREADHPNQACCHQPSPITIQHIVTPFWICKSLSYRLAACTPRNEKDPGCHPERSACPEQREGTICFSRRSVLEREILRLWLRMTDPGYFRIKGENKPPMTLGSSETTFSDCKESNGPVPTEKCGEALSVFPSSVAAPSHGAFRWPLFCSLPLASLL